MEPREPSRGIGLHRAGGGIFDIAGGREELTLAAWGRA